MDRLRLLWFAYLTVWNAAHVIRDPTEKTRMQARARRRLDSYFSEAEKLLREKERWLEW